MGPKASAVGRGLHEDYILYVLTVTGILGDDHPPLNRSAGEAAADTRPTTATEPDQKRMSERSHRQLVQVIASGDEDRAELIMRAHVYGGRDVVTAHLQAPSESGAGGRP